MTTMKTITTTTTKMTTMTMTTMMTTTTTITTTTMTTMTRGEEETSRGQEVWRRFRGGLRRREEEEEEEEGGGGRRRGKEEVGRSGGGPEERPEEVPKGRRHSMFVDFSSTHVDVRFFVDFRRRLIFDHFSSIFVYGRCSSILVDVRFSYVFC